MARISVVSVRSSCIVQIVLVLSLLVPFSATASPAQWGANGHYYEVIDVPGIDWFDAKVAAESLVYAGVPGHLVTISSSEESLWLTAAFGAEGLHLHWIGAYQPTGSTEPAGGWSWVTGEPWVYSNWWPPAEPNNVGGEENTALFDHGVTLEGKSWNDLIHNAYYVSGYVVEYSTISSQVPLPGSFLLLFSGLVGLVLRARRQSD